LSVKVVQIFADDAKLFRNNGDDAATLQLDLLSHGLGSYVFQLG